MTYDEQVEDIVGLYFDREITWDECCEQLRKVSAAKGDDAPETEAAQ